MGAAIGDSVVADGRAGELVDFIDGLPLIRPFPIPEQANTPGRPDCFVAHGEVQVLKKACERTSSVDIERERLAARIRARDSERRQEAYDRAAAFDRAWYRERER